MSRTDESDFPQNIDPGASFRIFLMLLGLMAGGLGAYYFLRPKPTPPPPAVAADPLLAEGRELYLARCVSCHGTAGKGDGPIAKSQPGPPPGDLTDSTWKHGDRPEQVRAVIDRGIKDTAMPGWSSVFSPHEIDALTAYVYFLAKRPVPAELRKR